MLVTHLSATHSYTIGRSSSSEIEHHHDSKETSSAEPIDDATTSRNQTSTEDDDDTVVEDSSSEEEEDNKVKRSAQFSTRNSDEFDDISLEINNNRQVVRQQTNPADRLPLVPLSLRNPVLVRQRNDDDADISIDVRRDQIVSAPVVTAQRVMPTQTLSGRLPVPISLRNPNFDVRQSDDDDVSLEIVNRDRIVSSTPVRPQAVVQTSQLPAGPVGFRISQIVRESDGDLSVEIVRDITSSNVASPNQPTLPAQVNTVNQQVSFNQRTPVFSTRQSDDDISVELFGSILNENVRLPTAVRPVQTSAIRPIQQANNRQQPIQTFTQVNNNNNVPIRPVTADARPQVQPSSNAVRQVAPTQPLAIASSADRLSLVPLSFRDPILVRQRDDDFDDDDDDISIEIRDRVVVTPVVQQTVQSIVRPVVQPINRPVVQPTAQPTVGPIVRPVAQPTVQPVVRPVVQPNVQPIIRPVVSTQTTIASLGRLPVPIGFRNQILRQSDEIDGDVSVEISVRDRIVFTPTATQQVNRPQANGQVRAPATNNREQEFVITQDFDGDVSVELVNSRTPIQVQSVDNQSVQQQGFSMTPLRPLVQPPQQQPVIAGSFVQTGLNEGQQQFNVFDDSSLEDDRDDDDDDDFFLEDQFDNVDGFRLLASDFFNPPSGNGIPSARSIQNHGKITKKDHDSVISLDESDFHVPAESDDWFLVKQYMDHDYSSEEIQLAKEYFWHPIKDSNKKVKTDQDQMDELKPHQPNNN